MIHLYKFDVFYGPRVDDVRSLCLQKKKKKVAGSNDRQGDMYTVGVIRGTQGQVNKRT